jgi:hypothetical protein
MGQIKITEEGGQKKVTTPTSKSKFSIPETASVIEKIEEEQEEEEAMENLARAFFGAMARILRGKLKSAEDSENRRLEQELQEQEEETISECGCL